MKKVTIYKYGMYNYFIDEDKNSLEYKPTIELPEAVIEDYKKVMGEFRRVQNALKEFMIEQKMNGC